MEVSGRRTENDDKVTPEHECQPCREDGDAQKAHGYCRNCKEYLCESCYKYHRRPKPFKNHVLVKDDIHDIEKDESKEDFDESPPPVPERKKVIDSDSKCHIHRTEDLKYHCRTHRKIVCSVCAIKEHKACKKVEYIPEICDSENKLLVGKIEYVGEKVEYKLQQEMEALQHAEKTYESALSALNTERERVNRFFAETEKGLSDKILSFRSENKSREKEMFGIKQKLIESKKDAMTTAPGSECKKYILMRKTEEQVDDLNRKLSGVFSYPSLNISYKPQEPLPELGEVIIEQQQGDVPTRKLKLLKKVNIAGEEGKCSITDMAIFPGSQVLLILTDSLNERLIIISKTYDVEFYQCSSAPWSVADISDAEIAVSFPYDFEVRFFTVGTTISCSDRKSIQVSKPPSGIGYNKSERSLIIAVCSDLETRSLDGVILRTVSCENDIGYLTLAKEEKILFSSYKTHVLCLVKPDGSVSKSFQYIDDNMHGPFGISSDASENIYVCGYQCLRMVSKEGKWEQIIAREDGYGPQAVLVCEKTNRLFVGQGRGQMYVDVLIFGL